MPDTSKRLGLYEQEYKTLEEQIQDMFMWRQASLMQQLQRGGMVGDVSSSRAGQAIGQLAGEETTAQITALKQKMELEELERQRAETEARAKKEAQWGMWGDIASVLGTVAGVALTATGIGAPIGIPLAVASAGLGVGGAVMKSQEAGAGTQLQQIEAQQQAREQYWGNYLQEMQSPTSAGNIPMTSLAGLFPQMQNRIDTSYWRT